MKSCESVSVLLADFRKLFNVIDSSCDQFLMMQISSVLGAGSVTTPLTGVHHQKHYSREENRFSPSKTLFKGRERQEKYLKWSDRCTIGCLPTMRSMSAYGGTLLGRCTEISRLTSIVWLT